MNRRRGDVDDDGREENRDVAAKKGWRAVFAGGRWDTEGGRERVGWTKEDTIPFVSKSQYCFYHSDTKQENLGLWISSNFKKSS